MKQPPFTPEQLQWLKENNLSKSHNTAWTPLRDEINTFIRDKYGKNPHAYALSDAVRTIIRFHLGVSNVQQINEDNIDEAKRIFELLKANV